MARQKPKRSEVLKVGELRFDVDCGLLFQLGEELVARRSVALGELIKNAYDADATFVTVSFRNVASPGGEITVLDDGDGMTFEVVKQHWMRIATTDKVAHPISPRFGRPRAGSKGIGRFAASRLAKRLEIVSVAKKKSSSASYEKTTLDLEWSKFQPGKSLEDVPVVYSQELLDGEPETGVTLKLIDVRDTWAQEDFQELTRDLLKLISPLPGKQTSPRKRGRIKDPGFDVRLEAEEFGAYEGALSERFLSGATAVLNGTLSSKGIPYFEVKFRRKRGFKHYAFRSSSSSFPRPGPVTFQIHFFVYKKDRLGDLSLNVREAQALGREEGGVHVYYDRFRIPPYGDPGDDWLKLDEDTARRISKAPDELEDVQRGTERPMLLLPANNQVFGRVHLSRFQNPAIRQTANRERFIENSAFEELRRFVRLGVDWMTVLYAKESADLRKTERAERDDPVRLLDRIEDQVKEASAEIGDERRAEILQSLAMARVAFKETREEQITELSMLRVLASTGTMISVFNHEIQGILNGLRASCKDFHKYLKKLAKKDAIQFERNVVRLEGWIEQAEHQGQLLNMLLKRDARLRRRKLAIKELVVDLRDAFAQYMSDEGIGFDISVPAGLRTPSMYQCEVGAILINLMTNALKAVKYQSEKRIRIEASTRNREFSIRVCDTGVGAAREKWEDYFRPFVSESDPDVRLGAGTGLGLKIVRDFVEIYKGRARFLETSPPWRTCVEVVIPDSSR